MMQNSILAIYPLLNIWKNIMSTVETDGHIRHMSSKRAREINEQYVT